MYTAEDIFQLMKARRTEGLFSPFPLLSATVLGNPVPLYDSKKSQSYWLVPFLEDKKVRGLAIVDLKGAVVSHGVLSPNLADKDQLIDLAFFDSVPQHTMTQVKEQYPGYQHSVPFLSFDGSPRKWGWYVQLEKTNLPTLEIYLGPSGYYEKKSLPDRE